MQHTVGGDALGLRVSAADLIVVGRAHANVIRDRLARCVNFDAHANLTAVSQNLVFVLVHQVGVDELQTEPIRVCVVFNKQHKAFAVACNAFDEYALRVYPRQTPIDRANSRLAPSVESRLELLVRYLIERPVRLSGANL